MTALKAGEVNMRKLGLLSVVVPCHNEEEVLLSTHERLGGILDVLLKNGSVSEYELIYVDNGSTDNTLEVLKNIFKNDVHVKVIALRRNFGYQGSISAGLYHAQGDAVITIDADLQDPPEKIAEMVEYFDQGYDLVLGVRQNRSTDSFFKRFVSEKYYWLMQILGVEIVSNHGDFRLMAKALVEEFNELPERNRFIRAMILKLDAHYATVFYARQPRSMGKSKFNPRALFSLGLDGVMSFSYFPLRIVSLIGIGICFFVLIGIFWVLYMKFTANIIPGWASILLPLLTLGGFQLLVLGLMGEYIGRLYIEVKHRPLFIVRSRYAHGGDTEGKGKDECPLKK